MKSRVHRKRSEIRVTSDRLSDDRGVVVGMVAGVKKVVVESFVEPIIEELHRTGVKQRRHQHSVCPPHGKLLGLRQHRDPYIEEHSVEQYLVIPAHVMHT